MRIGIDATAVPPHKAGAGVYTDALVRALLTQYPNHTVVAFVRGDTLQGLDSKQANFQRVRVDAPTRPLRLAWEQAVLPVLTRTHALDILHSPHHTTPMLPVHCPRVVTVHDITFSLFPQRYGAVRRLYMQAATSLSHRVADAIIVPSESVREDLCRHFGARRDRVHVVYEGSRFRAQCDPTRTGEIRARYSRGIPYILNVGSLEPGKNQVTLVRAFKQLRDSGYPHNLVIAGQAAWKYAPLLSTIDRLELRDCVMLPGYVPDEDLPALYASADVFAFPSMYEGFGLPVVEAMACGAPVVCSDRPAMPEIANGAALLVDPEDVGELAAALETVLKCDDVREKYRAAGLARATQFTWEQAARETMAVYRGVIEGGAG
jgi:glycosyltransferase involved in cell wall biosynthesis